MRREGRILLEYVVIIAFISIVAGGLMFYSMFKTSSQNIVDSSPKYQQNAVNQVAEDVLGSYSSDFIGQYNTLLNDPAAKNCADDLALILNSLANDKAGKMSNHDMLNILNAISKANNSGLSNATAKNMINNNICDSLAGASVDAMNKIETILAKDIITINYSEATCAGKCTITTSSNGLLRDIIPLFQSGQIPASVLTSVPNSPVSSVPTDIQNLFENSYYVGASTVKPGANYMNSITLLNYLYNNDYLPPNSKNEYISLIEQVKEAINNDIKKVKGISSTAHPGWEVTPVKLVSTTSTSTSTTTSSSSESSTSPPPFYFCE